jgi:hypothetical protein
MDILRVVHLPVNCCGTFAAKWAVIAATLLWSLLVLTTDNALQVSAFVIYQNMLQLAHENVWGGVMFALSGWSMWRLVRGRVNWIDALGYGGLALFWVYLAMSVIYYYKVLPPTLTPCVLVIAAMAIFAFVSRGPRGTVR